MEKRRALPLRLAGTALGLLGALAAVSPVLADSAHDSVGAFLILSPVVLALVGLGGLVTGYFMYRIFR